MANAREHFALDWIKADLLETLNDARVALDDYAEQGKDEIRLRACLTSLHQVHGTVVMLELKGIAHLADHLEQLAQAMLAQTVVDAAAASHALMQGILEMPGYLEELQRGADDSVSPAMSLVNEIRKQLNQDVLMDPAGESLRDGASDAAVARFITIGGPDKVARIRSAYQSILLSILKGEDRRNAVRALGKIAKGLERVTEGAPMQRQWQAFAEFITSLNAHEGGLEKEAVKLLRRVDLEIKNLTKDGEAVLRRPVNVELVQQLLDGAVERENVSPAVTGLQQAVDRDVHFNSLAISGRQALGNAAQALQEDLNVVKDRLDLLVRADSIDLKGLRGLITPLKQIGSILSVLGFESSREIVSDQINAIENLVVMGKSDPLGVQGIAGALVQIDENLSGVILGSEQTEVEKITSEAQLQVLKEARRDLDHVKQCIVDFVTAHWSAGHLESIPGKLVEICGALEIIPLPRVINMLVRVNGYVTEHLMKGRRPEWQELDRFADVVSALDYYLERVSDEISSGAEDILMVAERSLQELDERVSVEAVVEPGAETQEQSPVTLTEVVEITEETDDAPASIEATIQDVMDAGDLDTPEPAEEQLNPTNITELVEPEPELEKDADFDLASEVFADLQEPVEQQPEPEEPSSVENAQGRTPSTAAPPLLTADTESEQPDPEIAEIFVEEVDEVLANAGKFLPQWAADFSDHEALTEVRRAFHTLKGSGRIVQAVAIAELAWSIENMLNRVIEGTVTPNDQYVAAVEAARDLVPSLRAAFAQGHQGDMDAVALIIEQADLLASGSDIDTAMFAGDLAEESAPARLVSDIATDASGSDETEETVPTNEILDTAELPPAVDEDSPLELFISEAAGLLQTLEAANMRDPWQLSDEIARAFHTLRGAAALAGRADVQLIVDAAYQVVEAYRNVAPSNELRQFFVDAAGYLSGCLDALGGASTWEEPFEFVAMADDLLAGSGAAPRAVERLMETPATAALFDAEAWLDDYLLAGVSGRERSSGKLRVVLGELIKLAEAIQCQALASLAAAFEGALAGADQAALLTAEQSETLRDAYHQLIDQLNEIAAGTEPVHQAGTTAALLALNFASSNADVAESAAQTVSVEEDTTGHEEGLEPVELTDIDPDLVQIFFDEAEEISEELEACMLGWKVERDNRLFMENLLRGLHTLKGGARLCGLIQLGDMAHDLESTLIDVQSNTRTVDDDLFVELSLRFDEINSRLNSLKPDLGSIIMSASGVENIATRAPADQQMPSAEEAAAPGELIDAEKAGEAVSVAAARPGQRESEAEPALARTDQTVTAKAERGTQEIVRVGSALLEELVNLAGESSILRARIEQGMSDFTGALEEMETTIDRLREQLRRLEIETETQILHRHERTSGPQYENFDPLEMDRYNQLQQLSRGLSESASDMLDLKETLLFKARESETLLLQQARINTELQEGLMRTRMVPFSRLMPRLRRIVRQVSTELDKQVEFHVQNGEGELDRNLLERMVPPLEHMLRNALDHGIESASLRRNFGKSPVGRIDLRLTREGGDIVIEISDDGAGVDVESVRSKAIEFGLMAPDANLNDEEVLQFVLSSGFTTAKSVTQISGRGVGLDVVNSEVKQLGGSVSIFSQPNKGTRFVIRAPFTVSVNRALMVSVADDLYAIPLNTIEGIVLLNPEQLQSLNAAEGKTFEYAGVPYRVSYLGQYLGREYRDWSGGQSSVPLVLVRSGDLAVAVHVDLVQGSREIVVKSLGPQFAGVGGISGATILGDGSVVVILDLLALVRAQHYEGTARSKPGYAEKRGPRCVMVVDDSVTVRKVTSRLLERQGMEVLVAKDGIEAVAMLQERRPDIMLLDIEMPRMDGFEVARQVRHDEQLGDLPIIMISSRTGEKHKEHASQLGVKRFLGKPFQENELLATIDELLERR